MALTENNYVADGFTDQYTFNFEYIQAEDVKVNINDVPTTEYELLNATTVRLFTAPAVDSIVSIYRQTNVTSVPTTFFSGSTITAKGLNDNFDQTLFVAQEVQRDQKAANESTAVANEALAKSNQAVATADAAQSASLEAAQKATEAAQSAADAAEGASGAIESVEAAEKAAEEAAASAAQASTDATEAKADAADALSTATTALNASSAANTKSDDAVSKADSALSTANTANTLASSAIDAASDAADDAEAAEAAAQAALAAVALVTTYTKVADVASIPGSPTDGDGIQVVDSTGIESFTPLTGLPSGFVGDAGVEVSIIYNTPNWNYVSTSVENPDARYVDASGDNMTGNLTLGTDKITLDASGGGATFSGSTSVYRDGEGKAGLSVYDGTVGGAGNTREFYVNSSGLIAAGGVGGAGIDPASIDTTSRIVLDGSDGSAEFAGNIELGDFDATGSTPGAMLGSSFVQVFRAKDDTNSVWIGGLKSDTTTKTVTSRIKADGSAEFASTVTVGLDSAGGADTGSKIYAGGGFNAARPTGNLFTGYTTGNNTATVQIDADGSANFAGKLTVDSNTSSASNRLLQIISDVGGTDITQLSVFANGNTFIGPVNNETIKLNGSGSATFTGDVSIGNIAGGEGTVIANNTIYTASVNASTTLQVLNSTTNEDVALLRIGNGNNATNKFAMSVTGRRVGIGTDVDFNANNAEIKLETDGSATFAGNVGVGDSSPDAKCVVYRATQFANNMAFAVKTDAGGTKSTQFMVDGDGSASFASGKVDINSDGTILHGSSGSPSSRNALISYSNTAAYPNLILANSNASGVLIRGTQDGTNLTVDINSDGSAEFAEGGFKIYSSGATDIYRQESNPTLGLFKLKSDVGSAGSTVVNILTDGSATFAGKLLVGSSAARTFSNNPLTGIQVEKSGNSANRSLALISNASQNWAPNMYFGRSRGTTDGSTTIVANNDSLGGINWAGADGTSFKSAASIFAEVDGTPAANKIPGSLVFATTAAGGTSPTERIRFTSTGTAYHIAENHGYHLGITTGAGTTKYIFRGHHSATAGTPNSGTNAYTVWSNGDVQNANNSYGSLSDAKLKENIIDASSQWDDIKDIRVRNYNFIEGQTHTQIGVVAQEVEAVSPGLVYESTDYDAEGNDLGTVTKSVNYSVLYMKSVKALQEAMERIEALEARISQLEANNGV